MKEKDKAVRMLGAISVALDLLLDDCTKKDEAERFARVFAQIAWRVIHYHASSKRFKDAASEARRLNVSVRSHLPEHWKTVGEWMDLK